MYAKQPQQHRQYHHQDQQDSQLFLVRVWLGEGSDGKVEWHGKLQHMVSGEARPFHGCPQLREALLQMLPAALTWAANTPHTTTKLCSTLTRWCAA